MAIGVLPFAAYAADISEVSISGVRQPVAGMTFDTTYALPSGAGYEKDTDYPEIEWYDQGTSFSGARNYGAPSGTKLSSGAKAVQGHCYVAVLHLYRNDSNMFPKQSFSVKVSDEMAMRVQGKDGLSKSTSMPSYCGAVYLYYKTDVVYNEWNGIYLDLNRKFDGSVVAGERVWSANDFSFDGPQDFDLSVQWEVNGKTLSETDVFYYPGRTYTMWLYFKAQNYKRLGYFDSGSFVVFNGGDYSADISSNNPSYGWAKFEFTCAMTMSDVTIESIRLPEAGEAMQTSGFTCSPNTVSVSFSKWLQTTGVDFDIDATGKFKPNTGYRLELTLTPAEGYTLMNLFSSVIYVNVGTVSKFVQNADGTAIVGIDFRTGGETAKTEIHKTDVSINAPKAGELPSYVASMLGNGYGIFDDNEGYFLSGICWTDITQDPSIEPEERVIKNQRSYQFKAGHTYQVAIELVALEGYEFASDAEGKINGGETITQSINDVILLTHMFETLPDDGPSAAAIKLVEVNIEKPVEGNAPSFKATVPENAGYAVETVLWINDSNDARLTSKDKFVKNGSYILNITLAPKSGLSFGTYPEVTAYINGTPAMFFLYDGKISLQTYFFLSEENPFIDVSSADYYYEAVMWAYHSDPQVTNGVSDDKFGPERNVTRGQTVTFLWRAMGCPEPKSTKNPFVDVKSSDYFFKAVLWAVEKGITNGTDETHFSPKKTCSTAHIITFLYRTLGIGADGWYKEAGAWAKGAGLLDGLTLEVSPKVICPRADVVLFLYRKLAN